MAFCPNCGSQVADGEKFCGNCGTIVSSTQNTNAAPQQIPQPNYQQNVQPSYQQNVQPNYQQNYQQGGQPNFQQNPNGNFQQGIPTNFGGYNQQYAPQAPSAFGIAMGQLGKEIAAFAKNPIGTITKGKFEMPALATYLFTGLMTILLILQSFWGAAQVKGRFSSGDPGIDLGDLAELMGAMTKKNSGPGLGSVFLTSMFHVIIMFAVIWALALLINAVFMKGSFTAVHALNVVSFISLVYLIFSVVATIFNYIDPNVGQMVYLPGMLLCVVLYYRALGANANKPETTLVYSFLMVPFVLYLVNFIIFKIAGVVSVLYHGLFKGIM